jgi:hypothetical protein
MGFPKNTYRPLVTWGLDNKGQQVKSDREHAPGRGSDYPIRTMSTRSSLVIKTTK